MDIKIHDEMQKNGRNFMRNIADNEEFISDQMLNKPQPPLVKKQISDIIYELPTNFTDLKLHDDLTSLLINRSSVRIYTENDINLLDLSYLLWATQGVKQIKGNNYATLRTVPCSGARHPFETYLLVKKCKGLSQGIFHYLPIEHKLEFIKPIQNIDDVIARSVNGQNWAIKANVLFIYTYVPYRAEWRYDIKAYRPSLIDLGHIGENLYLASTALNLGTCGIAAYDDEYINNELLNIDVNDEYVVYVQPVGTK